MNRFSAGSYPYAERVLIQCSFQDAVDNLNSIKTSGKFDHELSFEDGPNNEDKSFYSFYFYSSEHSYIVHLLLTKASKYESTIIVSAIKNSDQGGDWIEINNGLPENEKIKVMAWLKNKILDNLKCKN
ncbi:hypothetical protein [Hymenobacter algoricola]|uniref:Uncharacterized protein n=1 Tax=Hymenobacter algoricola TaxID=486267 RepID=A0ABP7NDE5_9BACT